MNLESDLGGFAQAVEHACESRRGEGSAALRDKYERRLGFLIALQLPQRAHFIAHYRMRGVFAALEADHGQRVGSEVDLIPPKVYKFRHPEAVPVRDEDHRGVPVTPTVASGGFR